MRWHRYRAHVADGVPPGSRAPHDLAKKVVQQNISRSRHIGAGKGADDDIESEQRLDGVVLKPVVQVIGAAGNENIGQILLRFLAQTLDAATRFS